MTLQRSAAAGPRDAGLLTSLTVGVVCAAVAIAALAAPRSDPATWSFDPAARWPWWPGVPSELLVVFVAALFAIGLAAFARQPRSGAAQALLGGSAANAAAASLALVVRPDELSATGLSWAAFVGAGFLTLILWSSLVHLVFVFPVRERHLSEVPWLVPVLYAAPQLALLVGVVAIGALTPSSLNWLDGWPRLHATIVSALLLMGIVGIGVRVRSVSRAQRRRVAGVTGAVALAAVASLVLIDLPVALGLAPLAPRALIVVLALPIPVLLAVALWQDRTFRIDRLRRSRMAILHAREEERRRLRRDLHDGLGPTLAAIGLKVEAAASWIRTDPANAERLLDGVRGDLTSALSETRRLVRGLRPPALDKEGLAGAIRSAAAEFAIGSTSAPAITVLGDELPGLPAAVEVAAYRIVHECLTNSVRHSRAEHCDIRLEVRDGALQIQVSDDGVGFDSRLGHGVGTEAMRERVEELGGEIHASSTPGTGTRVQVSLPLAPA